MKARGPATSERTTVAGFLVLAAVGAAIAILVETRVIDAVTAKRGIGAVVGALAILTGNFLPKTRPFPGGANARAAERVAGWILVLAGLVLVGAFAMAPLGRATTVAAAAGAAALALILAAGIRLAVAAPSARGSENTVTPSRKPGLMVWVLVAFFYAFATAVATWAFAGQPRAVEASSWLLICLYTGFSLYLAFRGCGKVRLE